MKSNSPDRPLRKRELVDWLSTTDHFIDSEVANGELKARQLSVRQWVFLPKDVQDWLERKAAQARACAQAKTKSKAGPPPLEIVR
jgi:predicted DNA-binding transcriptional regulator AlpA